MGPLNRGPHVFAQPNEAAQLVGHTTQRTSDRCMVEGEAEVPTDSAPEDATDGEANHGRRDGNDASKDGFHE